MKHTITRALVTAGAAVLALTACAADDGSAADRHEQQHIEQLQEAREAQQMNDEREAHKSGLADPDPAPRPSPSFPDGTPTFEDAWTKEKLEAFMIYLGANSLDGFSPGTAEHNITAVDSPESGVIRFTVADADYENDQWALDDLAGTFMQVTGCAADDVDAAIAVIDGTGQSARSDGCY